MFLEINVLCIKTGKTDTQDEYKIVVKWEKERSREKNSELGGGGGGGWFGAIQ